MSLAVEKTLPPPSLLISTVQYLGHCDAKGASKEMRDMTWKVPALHAAEAWTWQRASLWEFWVLHSFPDHHEWLGFVFFFL